MLHNRLGEIAQQYLRKGSKVYIEGSLRTRQWTDQNGQERYTTEIRGEQMQMLDSGRQQGDQAGAGFGGDQGYGQPRFNNNQGSGAVMVMATSRVAVLIITTTKVAVMAIITRAVSHLKLLSQLQPLKFRLTRMMICHSNRCQ